MKILDAGTQSLDDKSVHTFIHQKLAQHSAEDAATKKKPKAILTKRPANYLKALSKHREHLEHAERPFANNTLYDDESKCIGTLMQKLEPRVQLTKTELLMLVNHRPHAEVLLVPMIEDIEARFGEEEQGFIVSTVVEVLGKPNVVTMRQEGGEEEEEQEQQNGDTSMVDG